MENRATVCEKNWITYVLEAAGIKTKSKRRMNLL